MKNLTIQTIIAMSMVGGTNAWSPLAPMKIVEAVEDSPEKQAQKIKAAEAKRQKKNAKRLTTL